MEIIKSSKYIESKKSKDKNNEYAICTDSISETAGTTERSKWDKGDKERYDRCLESVRKKKSNSYYSLTKEAKWDKDIDIEQPGKWKGYSLAELKKKRNAARKRQEGRDKANPKDTELLRELNFAIRAKTGWGKV